MPELTIGPESSYHGKTIYLVNTICNVSVKNVFNYQYQRKQCKNKCTKHLLQDAPIKKIIFANESSVSEFFLKTYIAPFRVLTTLFTPKNNNLLTILPRIW